MIAHARIILPYVTPIIPALAGIEDRLAALDFNALKLTVEAQVEDLFWREIHLNGRNDLSRHTTADPLPIHISLPPAMSRRV